MEATWRQNFENARRAIDYASRQLDENRETVRRKWARLLELADHGTPLAMAEADCLVDEIRRLEFLTRPVLAMAVEEACAELMAVGFCEVRHG